MRKALFTTVLFTSILWASKLHAQCELALSSLKLTLNQNKSNSTSSQCILNFDLSFYIDDNNGNKYIYIDLWKDIDYTEAAKDFTWDKLPTYSQLDGPTGGHGPIAVIGIVNEGVKGFATSYTPDELNINYTNGKLIKGASVTSTTVTVSGIVKTFFTITGLELILPAADCGSLISLKGIIMSTQSNGGAPKIHCKDDQFDFKIGGVNVSATSSLNCAAYPRSFNVELTSTEPTSITYKVYIDADGNQQLTYAADGTTITDPLAYTLAQSITVKPDAGLSASNVPLNPPYGTDVNYKDKGCLLVVSYSNISIVDVVQYLPNSCQTLPVTFQSFTAVRNQQRKEQVILKWETANEANNRGFYVQRKVSGQWKNIAFVFSQSENGTSNAQLAYEYKDVNASNDIAHYQIQQVDMDGDASYSDVKTVVGMNQNGTVFIYPNPALNGKINLMFKEPNNKEVIVNDVNGRVVKQFRQIKDYNLSIEGLQSGFYTIKVTDRSTAFTTVEKVIIKQ
jgi:hypothetical protein